MHRTRRLLLAAVTLIAATFTTVTPAAAVPEPVQRPAQLVAPMQHPGAEWSKDELLFHRTSGQHRLRNVTSGEGLGSTLAGSTFSREWDQIVPIDLDGDRQDELLVYNRDTGDYRFYEVSASGIGSVIRSGTWARWDIVRSIDLNGDQRDEMLLYSRSTGAYRYWDVTSSGRIGTLVRSGYYDRSWKQITSVDLDGDQRDEILFYGSDRRYVFHNIGATGSMGSVLKTGTWSAWTTITAVDADSDRNDELLFFSASTASYNAYDVSSSGVLGTRTASGVSTGSWSRVASLNVDKKPSSTHPFVSRIVDLVNDEREDAGLPPLSVNTQAQAEAQRWSQVQADQERMYHRSDLFSGMPSSTRTVGENVAMGYGSPESVMSGWMNSPGHRANILNREFTRIGVGVATDDDGTLYYTQIFFDTF